jgi:hypothetical protein
VRVATDLAGWLEHAGATVGGGMAFGAGVAFLIAFVLKRDFDRDVDVGDWIAHGTGFGALFGLVALFWRAVGVGP